MLHGLGCGTWRMLMKLCFNVCPLLLFLSFRRPDPGLRPPVQQIRERVMQRARGAGTGEEAELFLQAPTLFPSGLPASGTLLCFCFASFL